MPGSCSSGLRSRPFIAGGMMRVNGFDVSSMKSRKPASIQLITPSTRARKGKGRRRPNPATAIIHSVSSSAQSSSEPSCPPQTAVKR